MTDRELIAECTKHKNCGECRANEICVVVEVKHGEWVPIPKHHGNMKCSVCGETYGVCGGLMGDYNFCPNCEAYMRGEKMTVINKKPVPLYIKECSECGSTFTYRKAEVSLGNYISCPVCGEILYASFERVKDETEKAE